MQQKLAVIDVCGTLYHSNTTFDFAIYLNNNWRVFLLQSFFGKVLFALQSRLLGINSKRKVALSTMSGMNKEALESMAREFVQKVLINRKNKQSFRQMEEFKEKGYSIILMSASFDPIIKAVAEEVNADAYCSSKLHYENGKCTGQIEEDLLANKLSLLEQLSWSHLAVMTDNRTDLPILQKADTKIVVSTKKNLSFWEKNLEEYQIIEK